MTNYFHSVGKFCLNIDLNCLTIFCRIFVIHFVFKLWRCYAWCYWKFSSYNVPFWNYMAIRGFATNFAKNILVPSFDCLGSGYAGCHGKRLEHFLFVCRNWYHNCMDFNIYDIELGCYENSYKMNLMILVGYFTKYGMIFNFIEIDKYVEVNCTMVVYISNSYPIFNSKQNIFF